MRKSSGSVRGVLFETYNGCIKENYSRLNEFRVNDGGGSCRSCFGIKVRVDSAELTNTIIAGFGERFILV